MRGGKRGRVAEADVAGDVEDRSELLPSTAAKGPKPSLRNATASRSIFALVALIVIAIYLVATENTTIEKTHKATTVVPAGEKRVLVDIGPNVTFGSLLPDGVPGSVAARTPAAVVPAVVQPQATVPAVIEDGPLPGERVLQLFPRFSRSWIPNSRSVVLLRLFQTFALKAPLP